MGKNGVAKERYLVTFRAKLRMTLMNEGLDEVDNVCQSLSSGALLLEQNVVQVQRLQALVDLQLASSGA